jgi:16S rRNA (adenine(1408)-N(1))-methyltransferase
VRAAAARHPDHLVIGVDAVAGDALRAAARKLAGKPARGGLPNALLGRLSLADAPGELAAIADRLTVLLPWGGLLRAVARAEDAGLGALRGLCRAGAEVRIVFGYGAAAEAAAIAELALPPLDDAGLAALEARYREAGFRLTARRVGVTEVRELGTTWAGKIGWSGKERAFVELRGAAV